MEKPRKARTEKDRQHERKASEADVQHAIELMKRGHRIEFEGKYAKLCGGVIPKELFEKLKVRVKLVGTMRGAMVLAEFAS